MQTIPVQAVKNQTLTAQLNGQPVRLNIYQLTTGLFMDVFVNDVPIVTGVICQHANNIVRNAYLGLVGDFVWYDTQGVDDPYYSQIGSRWTLNYLTPAEL